MPDEYDAAMTVMDEPSRGPEWLFRDSENGMVPRHDNASFFDWYAAEPRDRICKSVFAHTGAHRYVSRMGSLFNIAPSSRAQEGEAVPLEDVSDRANKVYETMKSAGITSEDKMRDAEAITKMSKLPKNFVLTALQELQSKGYAKRRAREKAAGYWLIK